MTSIYKKDPFQIVRVRVSSVLSSLALRYLAIWYIARFRAQGTEVCRIKVYTRLRVDGGIRV